MAKLTFPIVGRSEVARQTLSFQFDTGKQKVSFKPGQFVDVTIPEPWHEDGQGRTRTFSLASSPRDAFLLIATRMTGSGFKRTFAEMPLGTPVDFEGPSGSFALKDNDTPSILFAGGIGITPFRSMIQHALETNRRGSLTLVYSNRTPEDAPFLTQLQSWEKDTSRFRLIAAMTQTKKSDANWTGHTGRVDEEFLQETLPDLKTAWCYLAGPPRFVNGLQAMLKSVGVAEDRIQGDPFSGY